MIAPRALRELSWAAGKLREVAKALSSLEVRLTVGSESGSMSGLAVGETVNAEHETEGAIQLPLDLEGQNALLRRS